MNVTLFGRERSNRIVMYTRNLANHLLYTKTRTLMLMVLYMIMPGNVAQSRILLGVG